MPQVADLLGAKVHFSAPSFSLACLIRSKNLVEAVEVLFPGSGEHDDVIEVEEACLPVKAGEDAIHEAGEGGGGVA